MTLLLSRQDNVGIVTLNRPERLNAINVEMGYALQEALSRFEQDAEIRCIVLSGAGRSFCAGDDLTSMESAGFERDRGPDPVKAYVHARYRWPQIVQTMRLFPKPIVASIRGHAHGAGLNLALAADIRIASDTLDFAIPFVKWGMATGVNQLHYFLPLGLAVELALTGESINADRAERLGLVNRVVEDCRLEEETMALARSLAAGPTRALGLSKAAIYAGWFKEQVESFRQQALAQVFAQQTSDREEGRRAFIEKRVPRFSGH